MSQGGFDPVGHLPARANPGKGRRQGNDVGWIVVADEFHRQGSFIGLIGRPFADVQHAAEDDQRRRRQGRSLQNHGRADEKNDGRSGGK
jgi:hypothetical protein